jgi:hypothetical protein
MSNVWQVASSWFSTLQNQAESQPAASPRLNRLDSSNGGGVPGSYAINQHGETGVQQSLEHLPTYGFRNNGPDSDQLQADRSHLLFGVSIDPSLGTSSGLPSHSFGKAKDVSGHNMLPGSFCPPATPGDSVAMPTEGLDDNVLMQRNISWPAVQTAPPVRSFTKVGILSASTSICLNILVTIICIYSIICFSSSSWILGPYMLTFFLQLICHHPNIDHNLDQVFSLPVCFSSEAPWGFNLATKFYSYYLKWDDGEQVHKLGSVGRSLDVRNFSNYADLRKELAHMFHLDCLMEDPLQSGWQIVFVDNENDTLLLGDDPWE